jgi:hypothetical protein
VAHSAAGRKQPVEQPVEQLRVLSTDESLGRGAVTAACQELSSCRCSASGNLKAPPQAVFSASACLGFLAPMIGYLLTVFCRLSSCFLSLAVCTSIR